MEEPLIDPDCRDQFKHTSCVGGPCECTCHTRRGRPETRAVGRFDPNGPHGYRAASMPDAPLRSTREEAESDERDYLK